MKLQEIMKTPVITVNKDATMKECGELLEKHVINGAPVVDDGRVVGVITRADVFKSILPRYPEIFKDERQLTTLDCIKERISKVTKIKVSEVMGSPAMTLDPEISVCKAGSILILRKIKQMPVVKDDQLVGIITLTDIFRFVMKMAGKG